MFDQVFANLQKATESTVKMQQEMLQKWVEAFPAATSGFATPSQDAFSEMMKKWHEISTEIVSRQKAMVDQSYEAGLASLENVFSVAESKSPEEYQQKVVELYKKSFESLRELTEAQLQEMKAAAEKCSQVISSAE
jgi:flagellar motor component MotA